MRLSVPSRPEAELLTIATIRKPRGRRPTQFLFNERQRIFALQPATKATAATTRLLRQAFRREEPVRVTLDDQNAGTAFATDPGYTATDATLAAYSTLKTCP